MALFDSHGRAIKDLRISLTDRCNFRCFYCLPNGEPPLARKDSILTFEEIKRTARLFVELGIEKIRLTGGEPMIRKDIVTLIGSLAELKSEGLLDLAMTSNGFRIPENAENLKNAGLDRLTLSMDSLDRGNFEDITGVDRYDDVINAIDAAKNAGLEPLKLNAVIVRGRNEHELPAFAKFARERDLSMRFIEFMPLDSGHDWDRNDVVSGKEIVDMIDEHYPIEKTETSRGSETSWKYRFVDGAPGEIGVIAPVTEMFCGACSRIRLTADGQIRTCLFSTVEHDLRTVLRNSDEDEDVLDFIRATTLKKEPRHYINDADFVSPSRSMSFIGG